jgi:hypothetical protein
VQSQRAAETRRRGSGADDDSDGLDGTELHHDKHGLDDGAAGRHG